MKGLAEGRIVHYVVTQGEHGLHDDRPAIVVKVFDHEENGNGCSNLAVFNDGLINWPCSVLYSGEPKVGTWHWPERA
jgi:hypothetical protein